MQLLHRSIDIALTDREKATAIVCNAIVLYVSLDECYTHHIYWCTYANFANQYEVGGQLYGLFSGLG